ALLAVLVEVDGAEHPERDGHEGGRAGDDERADHGRAHAAAEPAVRVRDVLGQEVPAHDAGALGDDVVDDQAEWYHGQEQGQQHRAGGQPVDDAPAERQGLAPQIRLAGCAALRAAGRTLRLLAGRGGHAAAPFILISARRTTKRASRLTTTVITNSTTPRPMSADRWTPDDSPNCWTITDGSAL